MKEHPILFTGEMVRAILGGRKTMTRRPFKPQPQIDQHGDWVWLHPNKTISSWSVKTSPIVFTREAMERREWPISVGDVFWVRETWKINAWGGTSDYVAIRYKADDAISKPIKGRQKSLLRPGGVSYSWRPSIHMPRWASRLSLRITDVRVERVQDISDGDITAEGIDADLIERLLGPAAKRFSLLNEYWVHGAEDEGISYCYECCKKEAARLKALNPNGDYLVDGGWGIEGDSRPYCETCEKPLDNTYTSYACESEAEYFLEHGINFNDPDAADAWIHVMRSCGFGPGKPHMDDQNKYKNIRRVSFQGYWDSLYAKRGLGWEANPWVAVYTFERI